MTSADLNSYVTFGYLACGVFALVAYVTGTRDSWMRKAVVGLLILVWASHTAGIGLRWIVSYRMGVGHAPLSNLYESLVFFAWAVGLALIVIWFKYRADIIVLFGLPIAFIIMASTFLLDHNIKPLIPALQSNWLAAHVITCFLGYACFVISFLAAGLLLAVGSSDSFRRLLPPPRFLDDIVYKSVLIGFPLLTIGIITGAAWADFAWGSYWSWDPKETWSLITWLVYAAFLHARLARGWSGSRTALLSLLGFAAVLFTYFGVNYLPGLHSYF